MNRREFESLLDQCLNRIDSDSELDPCLPENPEQAERIEPLLDVARELRALRDVPPRQPAAMAAGRAQFLAQAMAKRERQERTLPTRLRAWWEGLFQAPMVLARGMVTAAAVVLLILASLGGGALAVSAHSLPGDPLYPFKLARERVQLLFTFNDAAKEELQTELESRRIDETKALLDERRAANVEFSGTVNRISDSMLVIGGITVTLPVDVQVDESMEDGDQIKVEGWTQPDGSFIARNLKLDDSREPGSIVAPASPTASSTATSLPTDTLTPKPTDTAVPSDTPVPTDTPEPTASYTPLPTDTPKPADTATPRPSNTKTNTPEPTSTRTVTVTLTKSPTPTKTSSPTMTPTVPRVIKVEFTGAIERMDGGTWQIGGQIVAITGETKIVKQAGPAEIGALARVSAVRRDDGSLVAQEITIEQSAAQRQGEVVEFQGIIESAGDAEWVVSGTAVHIVPSTNIVGSPVIGWLAQVRALRFATGPLYATNIRVLEPEVVVQFEGVIQQLGGSSWVVEGRSVEITPETTIEGTPEVGRVAEIEAVQKSDGRLIARWIRIHELEIPTATPEPTPTLEPTATPEAIAPPATDTPVATAEPPQPPTATPTGEAGGAMPPPAVKETLIAGPTPIAGTPAVAPPKPTSDVQTD